MRGFIALVSYTCIFVIQSSELSKASGFWATKHIHMKKIYLILAFFPASWLFAQSDAATTETIKTTEFNIPAAPAYILLDASSPLVNQPGNIRDFKVDWSLRSYRLQPNLALEGQPIWEIFYNRPQLTRYQNSSGFMRTLSTLSLSVGTLQREMTKVIDSFTTEAVTVNQLAIAAKINLYREHDPLLEYEVYSPSEKEYQQQRLGLLQQKQVLTDSIAKIKSEKIKYQLRKEVEGINTALGGLDARQKDIIKGLRNDYLKSKWNASMVDVAVGRVFNYERPTLDSIKLFGSGMGMYLSGSYGIGQRSLFCGTLRYTQLDTTNTVGFGVNYRYGSPRFNFFGEVLYNVLQDNPLAKDKVTMAYGGDFRVGNNVLIGYSIRTVFDENLKFTNLIPVAHINCLMR